MFFAITFAVFPSTTLLESLRSTQISLQAVAQRRKNNEKLEIENSFLLLEAFDFQDYFGMTRRQRGNEQAARIRRSENVSCLEGDVEMMLLLHCFVFHRNFTVLERIINDEPIPM